MKRLILPSLVIFLTTPSGQTEDSPPISPINDFISGLKTLPEPAGDTHRVPGAGEKDRAERENPGEDLSDELQGDTLLTLAKRSGVEVPAKKVVSKEKKVKVEETVDLETGTNVSEQSLLNMKVEADEIKPAEMKPEPRSVADPPSFADPRSQGEPEVESDESYETYTMRRGNDPWTVSRRLKVNYQDFLKLNRIEDPRMVRAGEKLKIPRKAQPSPDLSGHKTYVIKRGEDPWTVSRRLKVDYQALLQLNGIEDPRKVMAGQRLKLPK